MHKKHTGIPTIMIIYFGMIIIVNFFSIIKKDIEYSSFENRTMAYLPRPKADTFFSGQWFMDFENYHLDQIAGRSFLIELDSRMQYMLGRREINEIEAGKDNYLLKKAEDFTEKDAIIPEDYAENQLKTLQLMKSYTDSYGGELYYLDIPAHEEFLWDKYRFAQEKKYLNSQERREIRIKKYTDAGINVIETARILDSHKAEELYFHTDHHYTFRGAYYVYLEMLKQIAKDYESVSPGYPEWDEMEHFISDKIFMGSYVHQIGDRRYAKYDTFQYALPVDFPDYERYESGIVSDMPLVRRAEDYDYTEYGFFMNGDNAQTVIRTKRKELPSILIIGYSFTNPLELMSVYNFNEVHSIDPRHFEGSICKYIKDSKCDIVVIVRNDIYEGNKQDCATFRE